MMVTSGEVRAPSLGPGCGGDSVRNRWLRPLLGGSAPFSGRARPAGVLGQQPLPRPPGTLKCILGQRRGETVTMATGPAPCFPNDPERVIHLCEPQTPSEVTRHLLTVARWGCDIVAGCLWRGHGHGTHRVMA